MKKAPTYLYAFRSWNGILRDTTLTVYSEDHLDIEEWEGSLSVHIQRILATSQKKGCILTLTCKSHKTNCHQKILDIR